MRARLEMRGHSTRAFLSGVGLVSAEASKMEGATSKQPNLLVTEVTEKDVAVIAEHYLEKWEDLSPFLMLTNAEETIRITPGDYREQKNAFLREWKRQNGCKATYCVLIQAAKEANNKKLADNIEHMLRRNPRKPLVSYYLAHELL